MAYLGEEIRKLGFGLMRLPQKDGAIDVEQVKEMTDRFLEAGFTYFDTAWAYAGSEDAIRQALVERYPRERYQLATQTAAWITCKTQEEAYARKLHGIVGSPFCGELRGRDHGFIRNEQHWADGG